MHIQKSLWNFSRKSKTRCILPCMGKPPLRLFQDLVYGFNGTPVTPPLNFSVNEGDFLCIVGKNGAGKSTLIKTLLGKHPAMSGTVFIERGSDQSGIGYLPQQILLLDEPTAGLDANMTEQFYNLLVKLNQEEKLTVIMVTHDLPAAHSYGSHILKIGPEPQFLSRENFKELNLD